MIDLFAAKQLEYLRVEDAGSAIALDMIGPAVDLTLTEPCDISFSNTTVGAVLFFIVRGGGTYAVTWPAALDWGGAAAPTLGARDAFVVYGVWDDAGAVVELWAHRVGAGSWLAG